MVSIISEKIQKYILSEMKYIEILRKFKEKKIRYFSLQDFQQITALNYDAARAMLQRYKKKKLVVNPKRGYYFFTDYSLSDFELASKLYYPSYLSLETVLSKEGVIPETIYSIMSVSTKPTRKFVCQNKVYKYYKIKKEAFSGYYKKDNYLIAEPEKAVADYFYFIALGKKEINERIDLRQINKGKLIKYGKTFGNQKLIDLIKEYA